MKALPSKQKGMTLIAWVFILGIVISTVTILIRLVPAYMESFAVKDSLSSLAQESNVKSMSLHRVQDTLSKKLYVNAVKSVKAEDLEVTRDGEALHFRLNYEVRVHAIGNIDAVLSFDKEVTTE